MTYLDDLIAAANARKEDTYAHFARKRDLLALQPVFENPASFDIRNTAVETDLFRIPIPAGRLGSGRLLRGGFLGNIFNNTGAGNAFTVRFKYGGTTLFSDVTTAWTSSANKRPFRMDFELYAFSAVSQGFHCLYVVGDTTVPAAGEGDLTGASIVQELNGFAAENSALQLDFVCTIQPAVASNNLFVRHDHTYARMES